MRTPARTARRRSPALGLAQACAAAGRVLLAPVLVLALAQLGRAVPPEPARQESPPAVAAADEIPAPDAASPAGADALLERLVARYADARSLRDTAYAIVRDGGPDGDVQARYEAVLALERPAEPRDAAPRWLYEQAAYREWGVRVPREAYWSRGTELGRWNGRRLALLTERELLAKLPRTPSALPLWLALGLPTRDGEPPLRDARSRTRLPDAELDGVRCHRVRLEHPDASGSDPLTLWIAADDDRLLQVETLLAGAFHHTVRFHPVLDAPVPDAALRFEPPAGLGHAVSRVWSRYGRMALLLLMALSMIGLGIVLRRRGRPFLLSGHLFVLYFVPVFGVPAIEWWVARWRTPSVLHARDLFEGVFQGFVLLVIGLACWLARVEWHVAGASWKQLHGALEALARRRGGEPRWQHAGRGARPAGLLELPGSGLRLRATSVGERGGAVRVRGQGRFGERRALRHELEHQLAEQGVGPPAAIAAVLIVFGIGALVLSAILLLAA